MKGSPSHSNNESSTVWQDVVHMIFDTMHSNGILRNHGSSVHLPIANGTIGNGSAKGDTFHTSNDIMVATESSHLNGTGSIDSWQRKPLLNHDHNSEQDWSYTKESHHSFEQDEDSHHSGMVKINLPTPEREEPKFPREKWKTLVAFLFLCTNWVLTTVTLAIVHERIPDRTKYPPLPDVVFDLIEPLDWALIVSEILIIVGANLCLVILLLHKYRFIIFRRIFLILGLLYMMRCITMFVTQVPVASLTYYCSPKANSTSPLLIMKRALQLISGFGLSVNGQHIFCGDYIYSGHTVILTVSYLIIKEYTPRRCFILHWLSWAMSVTGVIMVVISRGHYTVDVVIAYYVTTRVFWIYHTLANNVTLKASGSNNFLSRLWWFSMFQYFEANVNGVVPRQYEWPLPWPRRFTKHDRNS